MYVKHRYFYRVLKCDQTLHALPLTLKSAEIICNKISQPNGVFQFEIIRSVLVSVKFVGILH